jgi:3-oxoacyl-[acyl-carrier-protein] synthase-1
MVLTPIITGLGIVSSVGYSAQPTCAALRAGISRFTELKDIVNRHGEIIVVSKIEEFEPLTDRAKEIAMACCQEAISQIPTPSLSGRNSSFSLLRNEEGRPGGPFLFERDLKDIAAELGFSSVSVETYPYGNAAGMKAIADGQRRLEEDPTSLQIILGFDSLLQIETLTHFEKANRLKGASCARGLIPGEACACVILESPAAIKRGTNRTYCALEGVYSAYENAPVGSDEPCLGKGLTNAIFGALEIASWSPTTVGQVYCDLNGEGYRAHEWMLSLCRTLSDPFITHPADCIGDIGAAFCPLLVAWAAIAFERGYAQSDKALIFCSSDGGLRGSICLAPVAW